MCRLVSGQLIVKTHPLSRFLMYLQRKKANRVPGDRRRVLTKTKVRIQSYSSSEKEIGRVHTVDLS